MIPAPFWLSQTEVTFAQYDAFCEATSRTKPSDRWGRDDLPVINVDWHDAQAYAGWLGAMTGRTCRLPSEAEWEYAARAGTTKAFALPAESGGSDDISGKNLANCDGCGSRWDDTQTAPVARFEPNAWGLHDMHGNVWEWVDDCWHDSYVDAPDDGTAWVTDCNESVRVVRGGSWFYLPDVARSANRLQAHCRQPRRQLGFSRVVFVPIMSPVLCGGARAEPGGVLAPTRLQSQCWQAPVGSPGGLSVWFAAGRGTTIPTTRVPPTATGTLQTTATTTWVFACCVRPRLPRPPWRVPCARAARRQSDSRSGCGLRNCPPTTVCGPR